MDILVRVISDCNMVERIARACNGENSTHTIFEGASGESHRIIFSHSAEVCDYTLIINRARQTHKITCRKVFALQQEQFIKASAKYALPAKNEWAKDARTYRDCDVVFAFNEALFNNPLLQKTHNWERVQGFCSKNLSDLTHRDENLAHYKPINLAFDAFTLNNTTFVKYPPLMYFLFSSHFNYNALHALRPPKKSRIISCIASFDKRAFHGHIERMKFVRELANKVQGIDFFGRNTPHKLAQKSDGILPYKFSIAIENNAQSDYFSEKIMDCMLGFCIPIYCGAPNVHKYFPKNSFVPFDIYNKNAFEIVQNIIHSDFYEKNFDALCEARARVLEDYSLSNALAKEFVRDFKNSPSEREIRKIRAYHYPLKDRAKRYYYLWAYGARNILTNKERKHKIKGID